MPGAGHWVPFERAEEVNRLIRSSSTIIVREAASRPDERAPRSAVAGPCGVAGHGQPRTRRRVGEVALGLGDGRLLGEVRCNDPDLFRVTSARLMKYRENHTGNRKSAARLVQALNLDASAFRTARPRRSWPPP